MNQQLRWILKIVRICSATRTMPNSFERRDEKWITMGKQSIIALALIRNRLDAIIIARHEYAHCDNYYLSSMLNARWGWTFPIIIQLWKESPGKNGIKEKSANGITNRNHVQLVFICMKFTVLWPVCVHRILCQIIMDYHMIVCYRKPDLYSVGFVFTLPLALCASL